MDNAALDQHVGIYRSNEKITRAILREGNQLFSQPTGESRVPSTPASANTFFAANANITFAFEIDVSGETTHIVVTDPRGMNLNQRVSKKITLELAK